MCEHDVLGSTERFQVIVVVMIMVTITRIIGAGLWDM